MKKNFKIFLKIILIFFISIILFSCENKKNIFPNNNNFFIVLPHHSLTSKNIDNFYKKFSSKNKQKINNIVIISPNHYGE
jgi:predicted class III extradiol MEMO1 family dioxygenase